MKKYIIFILVLTSFTATISFAQSPAGVSTSNLKLWLRADNGITTCGTDSIASWKNQVSSAALTSLSQEDTTISPTLLKSALNYNNTIYFNGSNQFLVSNAIKGSDLLTAKNNSAFYVLSQKSGVVSSMFENAGSGTQRFGMEAKDDKMRFDFPNGGADTLQGGGQTLSNTEIVGLGFQLFGFTSTEQSTIKLTNTIYLNGKEDGKRTLTTSPATVDGFDPSETNMLFSLGKHHFYGVNSECDIAEVLIYNTTLSTPDREKVESYLGLKYGLMLEHNYVNSAGTIVFDISTYKNNITAIGRDDAGSFLQKQSRDQKDEFRLYISSIQSDNNTNSGIFTADKSYLIAGSNTGLAKFSTDEKPENINKRFIREWKITNTGMSDVFNIDFPLSVDVQAEVQDPTELSLLIDDDGNFSNASVYHSGDQGINITFTNGVVAILNIPSSLVSGTKYLTLGSSKTFVSLRNTESEISIFPNPNQNGIFQFNILSDSKIISLEVFDITGKLVYDSTLQSGYNQVCLDMLKKGSYIASLKDGNSVNKRQLIIY